MERFIPDKPTIFISYSHRDNAFANKLLRHLKVIRGQADFDVWSDTHIKPGNDWRRETHDRVEKADVAILLVSADYLASDWIIDHQLPALFEQKSRRGLRILPVIVRPCPWKHTTIAYYEILPRGGEAISTLPVAEQDKVLVELVDQVSIYLSLLKSQAVVKAVGKAVGRDETNRCFLSIPFSGAFSQVREVITEALQRSKVTPVSIEDIGASSLSLMGRLQEELRTATFIIADVTDSNPNVLYEVGFAQALQKPILLITQDLDSVGPLMTEFLLLVYEPRNLARLQAAVTTWVRRFCHSQLPADLT